MPGVEEPATCVPSFLTQSPSGGSTLMTLAPCSANIAPQVGPAMPCEMSTTRMPASGFDWLMSRFPVKSHSSIAITIGRIAHD